MTAVRDWRDPARYSFCRNLDHVGWAWEFLRRNAEYQSQFEEVLRSFQKEWAFSEVLQENFVNDPMDPDFRMHTGTFRAPFDSMQNWKIRSFVNPDQDNPTFVYFFAEGHRPGWLADWRARSGWKWQVSINDLR